MGFSMVLNTLTVTRVNRARCYVYSGRSLENASEVTEIGSVKDFPEGESLRGRGNLSVSISYERDDNDFAVGVKVLDVVETTLTATNVEGNDG